MPRRYVKRTRYNKDKYSIEQTNFQSPSVTSWTVVPGNESGVSESRQWITILTNPAEIEGKRKVKHLTISMANFSEGGLTATALVYYAIVYVPAGYEAQAIRFPSAGYSVNNYTANQFVMSSGCIDFTAGPTRIRTPLARNLNSGDSIYMILATNSTNLNPVYGQVTYAVSYQ